MKYSHALYEHKEQCCGCSACVAVCPKSAITMVEDTEGFDYPQVDEKICVRCHRCLEICSFKF